MGAALLDCLLDEDYLRIVDTVRACEEIIQAEQSRLDGVVWQISDICKKLSDEIKTLNLRVRILEGQNSEQIVHKE